MDRTENAQSVGSLITFGRFRVAHLGDLTWNKEFGLMCPMNRIGTVDLFVVSHHGQPVSNSPQLVHALEARAAIINNGTRKGGQPDAMRVIYSAPRLRIAVGGDSAGGNLSAVVSLLERDERPPAAQLLIYPSTDAAGPRSSHEEFDGGFVLTRRDCKACFRCYTGQRRVDLADVRISPLRAGNHAGAPPALVVVAGFDVLRDEGEAYAETLEAAGVEVRVNRFPSLEHGFVHTVGICPAASRAVVEIGRSWRVLAETAHLSPPPAATGARHSLRPTP